MRTTLKAAIAVLGLAGAAAIATPAAAQQFGLGIGPDGGISFSYDSGGYCDQWGCPDDFWDMPVYYGSVFFAGQWYDGPVYYRDWYGAREYWIHGQWRHDEWRGPHPGWWRAGHYGPALGMDYYRSHNFHGRWDNNRGNDRGRNFGPPDNRGRDFAPRDNRRDNFNGRGNSQAQPQQGPSNPAPQGFRPRGNGYGHYDRPQQSAPQQQAPQQHAQPQPQNNNSGHDNGRHGDHRRDDNH
jgi:hypothetical protein